MEISDSKESFSLGTSVIMDDSDPYAHMEESLEGESIESEEPEQHIVEQDEEQLESQVKILLQLLEDSPTNYQLRLQLIGYYKQLGIEDELTSHRETLADQYPLGEDVWTDWIEDEIRWAQREGHISASSFKHISNLFSRSFSDYLSVDLYIRWLTFVESTWVENIEVVASNSDFEAFLDLEQVRKHYEAVVEKLCNHLSRAGEIWEKYRSLEGIADLTTDMSDPDVVKQSIRTKRILYHRELSRPHVKLEELYSQYTQWEKEQDGILHLSDQERIAIQTKYENSMEELKSRLEHEIPLSKIEEAYQESKNPDYEQLALVRKYLEFETSRPKINTNRTICLYERTLAIYFLVLDIWQAYNHFILSQAKLSSKNENLQFALNLQRRSLRSYPYSHSMWCQQMITLERIARTGAPIVSHTHSSSNMDTDSINIDKNKIYSIDNANSENQQASQQYVDEKTKDEITSLFEKSLLAGLSSSQEVLLVYKQYLDFRIRNTLGWTLESQTKLINSLFESARSYFHQYMSDLEFDIEKHWAEICLFTLKDEAKARNIYEMAARRESKSAKVWTSFIFFEMQTGHIDFARSLYKRAVASDVDFAESIWAAWLDFERVHGNLETFNLAMERCSLKQRELSLKLAEANAEAQRNWDGLDEDLPSKSSKGRRGRSDLKGNKANSTKMNVDEQQNSPQKSFGKKVMKDRKGQPKIYDHADEESSKKGNRPHGQAQLHFGHSNFDPMTSYVTGLPLSQDLKEEMIRSAFAKFGQVGHIRIPRDLSGVSKGFAFVQLISKDQSEAIKKAKKQEGYSFQMQWQGQTIPLTVTSALAVKPPSVILKQQQQGYSVPIDPEEAKHTVFISNLSTITTEGSIEGSIRNAGIHLPIAIRVPKDKKTGGNRGMAYLDYEDEATVLTAVESLKDFLIDGRKIKAAPSAPTKTRQTASNPEHHPFMSSKAPSTSSSLSTGLGSLGGDAAIAAEKKAEQHKAALVPRSVAMKKSRIHVPVTKPSADSSTSGTHSNKMETD